MKIHHWLVALVLLCAVFTGLPDGYFVWSLDPSPPDRKPLDRAPVDKESLDKKPLGEALSGHAPAAEEITGLHADSLMDVERNQHDNSVRRLNAVDVPLTSHEFLLILDFPLADP